MEHQPHVWPTLLQTVIITVKMTMMMTITMITMIIVTIMMIASRLDFEPASYLVLPRLLLKAASIWINTVEAEDMANKFVSWSAKLYPTVTEMIAGINYIYDYNKYSYQMMIIIITATTTTIAFQLKMS